MYLLVIANGLIDRSGSELSLVAISSGNARRRKSVSLSALAFWNGSTATVVGLRTIGLRGLSCSDLQNTTLPTALAVSSPSELEPTLRPDSVSRWRRCRSHRISDAC